MPLSVLLTRITGNGSCLIRINFILQWRLVIDESGINI